MRLIIDASVVVAEGLRHRGRELIASDDLDLIIAPETWSEAEHELGRRAATIAQRARDRGEQVDLLFDQVNSIHKYLEISPPGVPGHFLEEARWRIPQDSRDIPTVALALWYECDIWTVDRDFFGCGLCVWSTEVLLSYLEKVPQDRR